MSVPLSVAAEILREAMRDTMRRYAPLYLAQGALMVLGGAIAVLAPVFASTALVLLLGWLLVATGLVQAVSLVGASRVPHFWLQLLSTALAVVVGLLFVRDPSAALATIALLLIVFFLVEGMAKIVLALTIRPFPNWGYVLLSGMVGVALAIVLWASLPEVAPFLIGLLLGVQLLSEGAALFYLAWCVRRA